MNKDRDYYNRILDGVNTDPGGSPAFEPACSGSISPDLMGDVEDDFYAAFGANGFDDGFGDFGGAAGTSFGDEPGGNANVPFQIPADFDGFHGNDAAAEGAPMGSTAEAAEGIGGSADADWHVKVFGTRGSLPTPGSKTVVYGGNTSCVSVMIRDQLVVFDAGSGIAALGKSLMKGSACSVRVIHLFLSHLHLDHLCGLMSFAPLFDPKVELHIYSGEHQGLPAKEWLCNLFRPPFWPVTPAEVPAMIYFHTMADGTYLEHPELGIRISAQLANHPDESLMYRLDALAGAGFGTSTPGFGSGSGFGASAPGFGSGTGFGASTPGAKSLVYGLDCELTPENEAEIAAFVDGAVLAICDAAYAPEDLPAHKGWGHSSWKNQTELLMRSGVHHGLMMHYAMDYDDEFLKVQETRARETFGTACIFAKEGMELVL